MTYSAEIICSVVKDCVWLDRNPAHLVAPQITRTALNHMRKRIFEGLLCWPIKPSCLCYIKTNPIAIFSDKFYPLVIASLDAISASVLTGVQPSITLWWNWSCLLAKFPALVHPGLPCVIPPPQLFPVIIVIYFTPFGNIKGPCSFKYLTSLWDFACHWCCRWKSVLGFLTPSSLASKSLARHQYSSCNSSSNKSIFTDLHCNLANTPF